MWLHRKYIEKHWINTSWRSKWLSRLLKSLVNLHCQNIHSHVTGLAFRTFLILLFPPFKLLSSLDHSQARVFCMYLCRMQGLYKSAPWLLYSFLKDCCLLYPFLLFMESLKAPRLYFKTHAWAHGILSWNVFLLLFSSFSSSKLHIKFLFLCPSSSMYEFTTI